MKPNPTPRQGSRFIVFLITHLDLQQSMFFSLSPPHPYLLLAFPFLSPLPFPAHNFFFFLWDLFIFLSLVFFVCLFLFFCFLFCVALFDIFVTSLFFSLFFVFYFVSLFEVLVVSLFSFWFLCVCFELRVCGATKEEDKNKKKGEERWRGRVTWRTIERGEFLVVYPLQTNIGRRSLLPLSWAFNCSKGLLLSLGFFDFLKFYLFIYFFF